MSNYTVSAAEAAENHLNNLRHECNDKINQVAYKQSQLCVELRRSADVVSDMRDRIGTQMDRLQGVDMQLRNLSYDFRDLEANLSELASLSSSLANQADRTGQISQQILSRAQENLQALASDHIALQNQLSSVSGEAVSISNRIRDLTTILDQQISEANAIVSQIEQDQRDDADATRRVESGLQKMEGTDSSLHNLIQQWTLVASELQSINQEVVNHERELIALSEAALNSPTLYALLQNLSGYRIDRIDLLPNGLEAFFKDQEGHQVRLRSQRSPHAGDALLDAIQVEIELDRFEDGLEHEKCDEELERILDLDGVEITKRTTLSPKPHRALEQDQGSASPIYGSEQGKTAV